MSCGLVESHEGSRLDVNRTKLVLEGRRGPRTQTESRRKAGLRGPHCHNFDLGEARALSVDMLS